MKMKKIISVLLLALTLTLFSSCIIVNDDIFSKYEIECYNNTYDTITDWCVKKGDDITYANSDYNCEIKPGKTDTISNLYRGYYSICISFEEKKQLHPDDYEQTDEIYLDENVTFNVARRKYYSRSASASDQEDSEAQYVVIVNGKEYPLYK